MMCGWSESHKQSQRLRQAGELCLCERSTRRYETTRPLLAMPRAGAGDSPETANLKKTAGQRPVLVSREIWLQRCGQERAAGSVGRRAWRGRKELRGQGREVEGTARTAHSGAAEGCTLVGVLKIRRWSPFRAWQACIRLEPAKKVLLSDGREPRLATGRVETSDVRGALTRGCKKATSVFRGDRGKVRPTGGGWRRKGRRGVRLRQNRPI